MTLALRPRLLFPAETPGELSKGPSRTLLPIAMDVLREAMARLPACRTLPELFSVIDACSKSMMPTARAGFLLRDTDACFELAHCHPESADEDIRTLTDRLIETQHVAQALKNGLSVYKESGGDTHVLLRISTPRRIYGIAIWSDKRIPPNAHTALGALSDVVAMSLDHYQGGAESFLIAAHTDRPSVNVAALTTDIAIPADQLTGLAHRSHFIRFIENALCARSAQTSVGVILLDIDGFHRVNRELGCDTGDQILRDVALRLDSALRSQLVYEALGIAECDICFSRTGADEFGLAISHLQAQDRLPEVAKHLHNQIDEGFQQRGTRLYLSLSIGLAASGEAAQPSSPQALLRNADTALKRAKLSGRNKHAVYDADWDEAGSPHLRTESLLQEALRQDHFTLHFQPLFDLSGLTLIGAEVLLRLSAKDGTPIPPSRFIPVAESTGQIADIGAWVTRQLCRQIQVWDALGYARIPFAINLSAIELSQPGVTRRASQILTEEHIASSRIHIEITETAIARNEEQALSNVRELREAGFEVWIDDFGTGYSSLKSLKNFPISGIKLDREFVKDLIGDTAAERIASSILEMAKRLGYPVVAEGIETAEQLAFLRTEGCELGQGFHLGRPVAADEFEGHYLAPAAPADADPGSD